MLMPIDRARLRIVAAALAGRYGSLQTPTGDTGCHRRRDECRCVDTTSTLFSDSVQTSVNAVLVDVALMRFDFPPKGNAPWGNTVS